MRRSRVSNCGTVSLSLSCTRKNVDSNPLRSLYSISKAESLKLAVIGCPVQLAQLHGMCSFPEILEIA